MTDKFLIYIGIVIIVCITDIIDITNYIIQIKILIIKNISSSNDNSSSSRINATIILLIVII